MKLVFLNPILNGFHFRKTTVLITFICMYNISLKVSNMQYLVLMLYQQSQQMYATVAMKCRIAIQICSSTLISCQVSKCNVDFFFMLIYIHILFILIT